MARSSGANIMASGYTFLIDGVGSLEMIMGDEGRITKKVAEENVV